MTADGLVESVSKNLLFRYTLTLRLTRQRWKPQVGRLSEAYRLPCFGLLEGQPPLADFRSGWSDEGIAFDLHVRGRRTPLKCDTARMLESDGLQLWIDTRPTQSIQRASRFCHWFVFLPSDERGGVARPVGTMLRIRRAKEDPKTFQHFKPLVASEVARDGYRLSGLIPAAALGGWDPAEHPRIGFHYAVVDRELGWQTLGVDFRYPIAENPSLWTTLELAAE